MSVRSSGPRRGRAPDPAVTARILEATRGVVREVGVRNTTVTAIARACGCGTQAIRSRWPDTEAVILAALVGTVQTEEVRRRFLDAVVAMHALMMFPDGRFLAETVVLPNALDHLSEDGPGR